MDARCEACPRTLLRDRLELHKELGRYCHECRWTFFPSRFRALAPAAGSAAQGTGVRSCRRERLLPPFDPAIAALAPDCM
jgi:hypothetical protein